MYKEALRSIWNKEKMVNNPGNEDFYEEEKFTVHHSFNFICSAA
jgi:hypothetical protein